MQTIYSKGFSGWSQLAILLGFVGLGIVVGALVSIPIWEAMAHGSLMNMATDMLKPENAGALQMIQIVSTLFTFFIPTLGYAFVCYRNGWTFLGFTSKIHIRHFLIALLMVVCAIPLISALQDINKIIPISNALREKFDAMEKKYNEQVLIIAQVKTWAQYCISLLVVAVLPAVTEEILFRGGLQNLLARWTQSPWFSIILTSILFSIIHFSWYGFLARFFLGMVLGIIFHYTRSIWLNMLVHFVNNGMVVTMMFVMNKQGKPVNMEDSDHIPLWVGGISLIIFIFLLKWLIKTASQFNSTKQNVIFLQKKNNPFDE